ncbi:hypothetical protein EUX98_g7818 [Antrodiella citrinella]|uniref:alpha-1,2-Mannosidase n=1 Tax=Antrodiella citrinella TaxID=2447956 RepID=A0A4V3XHS1_9APHY|nr:hypothetical protein EUX98_g7818 [Antrodiella citrinella]
MLLMGLTEQFERAMAFVSQSDFTIQRAQSAKLHMNREVSFFETAIRYLGGLLSAYALSNEAVFLQKADELASILAPAFDTGSGFPRFGFDILTGLPVDRGISGSLAEVASCQLEYAYLARLTGKKEHYDRSAKIFDNLRQVNLSETGMLPKSYGLMNGEPLDRSISVGGGSDSGHEYLLKYYLLTGQKDDWSLDMYMRTINHVMTKMLYVTPRRGLLYITDIYGFRDTPAYRMEHLSCFFPGLLALGVHTLPPDVFSNAHKGFTPSQAEKLSGHDVRDLHMWAAIGLGETCWRMYADEASGLSPELIAMRFPTAPVPSGLWVDAFTDWKVNGTGSLPPGTEDKPLMDNVRDYEVSNRNYYLRPETVESMYLLWKATGDELWRDRGWVIFEALEKEARTEVAYAPLKNVAVTDGGQHDDMPSFFLAETLKYLYLLFLDEDPVPLDKWVYNTEAHPFPIFEWSSLEKSNFNISES